MDRKVTIPLIGYFVEPPIPLITAINCFLYVCTSFTHLDVFPMQWLEDRKLNILELPSQGTEQRGVYGFGPPRLGVGDTGKNITIPFRNITILCHVGFSILQVV